VLRIFVSGRHGVLRLRGIKAVFFHAIVVAVVIMRRCGVGGQGGVLVVVERREAGGPCLALGGLERHPTDLLCVARILFRHGMVLSLRLMLELVLLTMLSVGHTGVSRALVGHI
jgi:hypothetical protein